MDNDDDKIMGSGDVPLGGGVDIVRTEEDIDDIEIESYNDDVLGGGGSPTPQEQIKRLRERLHEAVREKQEYLNGWQRLKADFANYKKREEEGKQEFMKFSREGIITDLLPTLESFHMAFSNKEQWEKVDPSWRIGVEYIYTQFLQTLSGYGLSEVNPLGKPFDSREHTSIGGVPTKNKEEEHKVAEVVQVGYRLNGKLIRSPKVKVYELSA